MNKVYAGGWPIRVEMSNSEPKWANIKVRPDVRDRVKSLKRGGDSYSDVLRKMCDQYDPDEAKA